MNDPVVTARGLRGKGLRSRKAKARKAAGPVRFDRDGRAVVAVVGRGSVGAR